MLALSAGCIADGTDDSPDDNDESDDPSEDDPGSDDGGEDLPEEVAGYETQNYQFSTDTETETSSVDLVRDADDATEWLETRTLSDTDPLTGFVDDTDFETSVLVSLESEAPNPCYELVLESIDVQPIEDDETDEGNETDDGSETDGDDEPSSSSTGGDGETDSDGTDGSADKELVLEAGVRDTADENEACTPVITTVGRLVRVTFESEPLTALSATVVDHEGNTSGALMRSDSASASESTSVESDDGTAEDGS
ncbi:hypothetical protein C488_11524 [Natrinema pellirubrum DSM 15624]|uniref:Uncharacterized protein n=1 Tax=Natrinema pellirubrum (strain DSM 15624 / CIP 106293 / JCM 10476 / NCIMB 786 / 157) TaxID=797303 RepID=L9YLW9_NATP1|nr:hypothetical protein C488_11524 [Natrinema pellirubrum DSM 15624]